MASYKVPQDVEADDKLIGPFSFRQFLYLIIVAMAGTAAWGLAQLFIGLAIIPLPIIIFFGVLALPLRKDQPMEIYMAAMVSFYLKPRLRKWDPEGVETLIEISAPKIVEVQRTKDISQNEAEARLSYLANIVDSGGWAIRGVSGQPTVSINNDVYLEAQSATDVLDTNTTIAHNFDQMMAQSTDRMHEEAMARMREANNPAPVVATPVPITPATTTATTTSAPQGTLQNDPQVFQPAPVTPDPVDLDDIEFNPYPTFHQSIIQPLNDTSHQAKSDIEPEKAPSPGSLSDALSYAVTQTNDDTKKSDDKTVDTTSDLQLKTDIINLANNPDLSIETIAHEAKRIHKKAEEESDEVVISLR